MNVVKAMTLIVLLTTLITFTMAMNRDCLGKQTTTLNSESLLDQDATTEEESQNVKYHHRIKRNNANGMGMKKGNGMFKGFRKHGAFIPPGQYRHMLQQQQQQQQKQPQFIQPQFIQQHPQQMYVPLQSQTIFVKPMTINKIPVQQQQEQPQFQPQFQPQLQPQLQQQAYVIANQAPTRRQVPVQPQVIVVESQPQIQTQLQPQPLPRPSLAHQNHVNLIQQQQQQQQQQPPDAVILISQLPSSHPQQTYQVQTIPQQQQQIQAQPPFRSLPVNIQQNNIVVTAAPQNRLKPSNGPHSREKYEQQLLLAQISETLKNDQQNEASASTFTKPDKNDVEIIKNPNQLEKTHQAIITQPTTTTTTTERTTPNPRIYDLLYGSNLNSDQQQQQQTEESGGNEYGINPRLNQF